MRGFSIWIAAAQPIFEWHNHVTGATMTWKPVHYWPSFGKQGYYPNLPSKFLSGDDRNAWMWYGANFSPWDRDRDPPGSGYHLCEQRIRFLTAADTP